MIHCVCHVSPESREVPSFQRKLSGEMSAKVYLVSEFEVSADGGVKKSPRPWRNRPLSVPNVG
jgi:hypothetical protein